MSKYEQESGNLFMTNHLEPGDDETEDIWITFKRKQKKKKNYIGKLLEEINPKFLKGIPKVDIVALSNYNSSTLLFYLFLVLNDWSS